MQLNTWYTIDWFRLKCAGECIIAWNVNRFGIALAIRYTVCACVCGVSERAEKQRKRERRTTKWHESLSVCAQIVQRHQIETEIPDNATYFEIESIFNHLIRSSSATFPIRYAFWLSSDFMANLAIQQTYKKMKLNSIQLTARVFRLTSSLITEHHHHHRRRRRYPVEKFKIWTMHKTSLPRPRPKAIQFPIQIWAALNRVRDSTADTFSKIILFIKIGNGVNK